MDRYEEALERAKKGLPIDEVFPELKESEDERLRKELLEEIEFIIPHDDETDSEGLILPSYHARIDRYKSYLEKQKEQKPIIQDVELNDAVYDYVRDHFIAGADFTPEYIKKLMENAFFAGVDYYLLKQESESCEPGTNVEKVIEDVIRVYGKTQGEWVGGYDIDTLIVNLRRAFNKKEQKPAEWGEEDENMRNNTILSLQSLIDEGINDEFIKGVKDEITWLKSLRPQPKQEWSEEDLQHKRR